MKIAMFGQKTFASRAGGMEVVVEKLSRDLVRRGHGVTCYDRGGKGRILDGVRVRPVPALGKGGLGAVTSGFFAAVCAAFGDAGVVHIHGEGPAFWCPIPKWLGKRVVVTIHGLDWQREKWRGSLGKPFIYLGERAAVRYADAVIVLTEQARRYFRDTYGRETVRIPNGASRPEPKPARLITRQWGLERDGYLLYLGRLVPEKGVEDMIRAYRQVKTDKRLVIAGAADSEGYLRRLRTLAEGDGRILFTGFAQGTVREELYSNAWLYILPSYLEGMPLSLLEAMSYGNCCLVSDLPECRETARDQAVYFERGNVRDLEKKLARLCGDESRVESLRSVAAAFVGDHYSWEAMTERTLETYR